MELNPHLVSLVFSEFPCNNFTYSNLGGESMLNPRYSMSILPTIGFLAIFEAVQVWIELLIGSDSFGGTATSLQKAPCMEEKEAKSLLNPLQRCFLNMIFLPKVG